MHPLAFARQDAASAITLRTEPGGRDDRIVQLALERMCVRVGLALADAQKLQPDLKDRVLSLPLFLDMKAWLSRRTRASRTEDIAPALDEFPALVATLDAVLQDTP
ncbi:hypothetical protein ACWCOP_13075 [Maricaulaceae bacterium MS644]